MVVFNEIKCNFDLIIKLKKNLKNIWRKLLAKLRFTI